MEKIKVYSTKTCPYCYMLKDYLTEKNLSFEDVDVSSNHGAATEMVRISGQRGVPVADINGHIIVGFDPQRIERALGI